MKVLVACEFFGTVRDVFLARGHEAVSCDLLESESYGPHVRGDVRWLLTKGWDLMIAHPPCTYLCNSGVCHLHTRPGRWELMRQACDFFLELLNAPIPRIAVENPRQHKYAREIIGPYSQVIHPHEHGHGESKATCLWLKGLPPLMATDLVPGRVQRLHRLSPGPDRWKLRSATYPGIANAMAEQWGNTTNEQEETR